MLFYVHRVSDSILLSFHSPLPSIPAPSHGDSNHLWQYVTVKDALKRVKGSLPNMEGRTSGTLGQHGIIRLKPHKCAPTIRATSGTPFHYAEDRPINVREAASLQSFPLEYEFIGNLTSQYRLIGNGKFYILCSSLPRSQKCMYLIPIFFL